MDERSEDASARSARRGAVNMLFIVMVLSLIIFDRALIATARDRNTSGGASERLYADDLYPFSASRIINYI